MAVCSPDSQVDMTCSASGKNRILYYSECFIFGGCENLLVNLIRSPQNNKAYDIHFAYAKNKDYERQLCKRLIDVDNIYSIAVLTNGNLFHRINTRRLNWVIKKIIKLPFYLLKMCGLYSTYNIIRLFVLFRTIHPDLLHINNGGYPAATSCLDAVISARLAGVKRVVFTVNNIATPQRTLFSKCVDKMISRFVDKFVTASSTARNALIGNRAVAPGRIVQIFNSMQDEFVTLNRISLLKELSIRPDKFVIVSVAFLTRRKGQIYILKALRRIRDLREDVFRNLHVVLVGDGEDRSRLELYITQHGLRNKVTITGFRSDYYDFINAADLFVLASIGDEDMPLVILSAMALAKPIISTTVAGINEEIRNDVDGFLLDPVNLDSLNEVLIKLYLGRQLGVRYGNSARERYNLLFTLDQMIEKYHRLYDGLLKSNS